jgi:multicomponent Na+:H+ antiporter subunit D
VGLLTLFSMAKIWAAAFWGALPQGAPPVGEATRFQLIPSKKIALYLPMIMLGLLTLTIGLMPEPFFELATRAAEQLLNPAAYIQAVLEGIK